MESHRIVYHQVRTMSSVSVTSRASVERTASTVPYRVYAALGRDYDFLRGQNAEIRRMIDNLVQDRRVSVEDAVARSRVRAVEHIFRQRIAEFPSTIEWAAEARLVTRLICWILGELRTVRGLEP